MLRAPIYGYFRKRPVPNLRIPLRILFKNFQLAMFPGSSVTEHIFVVGPPRNGTTLVQNIFASHPQVAGSDTETFFFLKRRLDTVKLPELDEENVLNHFLKSKTTAQFFDSIAKEFTEEGSQKFVEKSPEHALVMPRILKIFPKAKIIFIYRDGRDAYISALKHSGVRLKIGENYPLLWRDSMHELKNLGADPRVLSIKYEELCEAPEKTLRPIIQACGLDYLENLLQSEKYSRTVYSQKKEHRRLQEAISARTVGIHHLPENKEYSFKFESVARDMLLYFGYLIEDSI